MLLLLPPLSEELLLLLLLFSAAKDRVCIRDGSSIVIEGSAMLNPSVGVLQKSGGKVKHRNKEKKEMKLTLARLWGLFVFPGFHFEKKMKRELASG